jgi:hypothetical protein
MAACVADMSAVELHLATAQNVRVTDDTLVMDLTDGRTISVPIVWYPRLLQGTPEERNHWWLIGQGEGIYWPDFDEDINVQHVLLGKLSPESQASLQQWLAARSETQHTK